MAEVAEIRAEGKRNRSFAGEKLDWITATIRRAPPSYVVVGIAIIQHMNSQARRAKPSQERLAAITGLSVETVKRAVKWFEANGWLRITRIKTFDPKTRTPKTRNFYWLRMDNVAAVLAEIAAIKKDAQVSPVTPRTHLKRRHTIHYKTPKEVRLKTCNITVLKTTALKITTLKRNAVAKERANG